MSFCGIGVFFAFPQSACVTQRQLFKDNIIVIVTNEKLLINLLKIKLNMSAHVLFSYFYIPINSCWPRILFGDCTMTGQHNGMSGNSSWRTKRPHLISKALFIANAKIF